MILWYYNIDDFPSEAIAPVLSSFPETIVKGITRYRFENDRKSRLIARLLVQKYVLKKTNNWNWDDWKKGENHKPKLEGGPFFNISHSETMVVLGFDEAFEIGVDVEKVKEIDVASLSNYFHPDEISYLEEHSHDVELFYEIWTKKEAFLKACGTGIVKGLDQISVLKDQVIYEGIWNVKNIAFLPGYKCAICSKQPINQPDMVHIHHESLHNFIRERITP